MLKRNLDAKSCACASFFFSICKFIYSMQLGVYVSSTSGNSRVTENDFLRGPLMMMSLLL
jgi:hypothetical protein